jgi:hypothetical protein
VRSTPIIGRLLARRDELLERFAAALVVETGRRAGDPETRVRIDLRYPDPDPEAEGEGGRERWRLRTARHRLAGAPFGREALAAFHGAEAQKGRRLTAVDLGNEGRVAALMAWHFESSPAAGGSRRPHLVVALAVAEDARGPLRGEYLVACWLLCLLGLAIDRRTVAKGRIGVVLDTAIDLPREELAALGFKPGRRRGGYRGDYFELVA